MRDELFQAARDAVKEAEQRIYRPEAPYTLEVTVIFPGLKELISYIPGVRVTGPRSVEYTSDDYLELTKVRILMVNLTKMVGMQVKP